MTAISSNTFTKIGSKIDSAPVEISYRILELFSGGLYSSPTKAIEELVANSYDAVASTVQVIISTNLDSSDAYIVIIDDGESMDVDGLKNLWKIGESFKRSGKANQKRLPIGRFGIGKLATWVLAKELTHICKRNKDFLAVTMFYGKIDDQHATQSSKLKLDIRKLTEAEAIDSLSFIEQESLQETVTLFGKSSKKNWTVSILSNLKPMAKDLKIGRLRWVLSTAMPLSPDFQCYLNGNEVEPTKLKTQPLQKWIVGKDDKVARNLKLDVDDKGQSATEETRYGVNLSVLKRITGVAEIYEDSLKSGKSEEWGRSHGFFVMVRGRLINLSDPLFGNTPLSHKTFNRFRMIVHCNGLDEILLSSREGVTETDGTEELKSYLRSKFNEVAAWYENWLEKKETQNRLATRLGNLPRSLMRRPLIELVINALNEKIPLPRLTRIPTGLTKDEKKTLLEKAESYLQTPEGFITDVVFEPLSVDSHIAIFDVKENKVIINSMHPFYRNYEDYFKNTEPFETLGVAEVLTEAYLLQMGIRSDDVNDFMMRRDSFLRELIYAGRVSAPLAADMLREAGGDIKGLENAVASALMNLGFIVNPIGGSDEPDGAAYARSSSLNPDGITT